MARRIWEWQQARLEGDQLVFQEANGMAAALADGFFLIEQPPGMDLTAGDRFARSFYLPAQADTPDPYRNYQHWTAEHLGRGYQGYYRRDSDQTEQFFLESASWRSVYPPELARQAAAMRDFALGVLRAVLVRLDLPSELLDEATGRCLSARGTYTLTFNHFRPEVRARGLNLHKDSGWLTVLRSLDPGLEVQRGGDFYPIDPVPGTFIVNFGCAMEILTRATGTPVAAVAHRVVEQATSTGDKPDRFSYAMFVDSSLDERICPGLFRYDPGVGLVLETSFESFLANILENTYQSDTTGLY